MKDWRTDIHRLAYRVCCMKDWRTDIHYRPTYMLHGRLAYKNTRYLYGLTYSDYSTQQIIIIFFFCTMAFGLKSMGRALNSTVCLLVSSRFSLTNTTVTQCLRVQPFPHTFVQAHCYRPYCQLRSDFGDFSIQGLSRNRDYYG